MNTIIWSHILYELALAVSGEQELDKLACKAVSTFFKKLDCIHAGILQHKNNSLEPLCIIPHAILEDPAYYVLIDQFQKNMAQDKDKDFIVLEERKNIYGFPLHRFGLLVLGKKDPFEEPFLKELLPITNMLAQNLFFNLDTARKQWAVEDKLKKERHLLRVILDAIPDLIFFKDINGVYKVVNKTAGEFSSLLQKREILDHTDWEIHSQAEASKSRIMDQKVIDSGQVMRFEEQFRHHDGHLVPLDIIKVPIYDAEGKCLGIVGISRDITERKHYEQQLEYASAHDQLTGLYNRRFLEKEIERLDTFSRLPISIIVGDLNGLKLANDIFGHQAGDNLLIKTAKIIRKSCREEDLVARWGGDEFVIFLPQTTAKTAELICRRIKKKCDSQKSGHIQMGIALGRATKNKATESIWQLLKEAGDRMYSDKYIHTENYKRAVISSLKTALSKKSMETEEQAERLKKMCRKIGNIMGLNPHDLSKLELLALLHNIGKVAIKKSILMKPGPLTEEEQAKICKHPEIGYRLARAVPELSPIAECILSHHERWDGKGYPRGIKGEGIPPLSRILAVADAFDAITNNRPYRKAKAKKEALTIIKENAGTQFDPRVVDAFCQLFDTDKQGSKL